MESELIIACVRTGTVYPMEYVRKLRNMVFRHLLRPHVFVCLTDQADRCEGVTFIDIGQIGLQGRWAKMVLFAPEWRLLSKVVYIDLNTVILGNLLPLTAIAGEFAICENYERKHPCRYSSSVMVIGGGQAAFLWRSFDHRREWLMVKHRHHAANSCIEDLCPQAPLLQRLLPKGYLCDHRKLTSDPPKAAIVSFGVRLDTCTIGWVQREWC